MFIDLTLEITKEMWTAATTNLSRSFNGHIGTHFDVENQTFPLEYCRRKGWIFDVRSVPIDREIGVDDIDLSKVESGMFVGFFSGYIETEPYGSKKYFAEHPALSVDLIEKLIEKEVSLVGLDFSGMRLAPNTIPWTITARSTACSRSKTWRTSAPRRSARSRSTSFRCALPA